MPLTCFFVMSHPRRKMNPTVGNTKVYSKEKFSPVPVPSLCITHKEMLNAHFNKTTK